MTHTIATLEESGGLPYFQRLWRTLLAPNIEPKDRLERLFEQETAEFGLNYAFLSQIDLENEICRFEITHGSDETLQATTTMSLSKTYCRKTIADPEGTLAISDAVAEGWEGDPAYETCGLRSYLGTVVSVDDELYGTLCFADSDARDEQFTDTEKALIEMYAQWVEYTLTLWGDSLSREIRIDTVEGRTVSSEAINSMMETLRSRIRRVILMSLLGDTTEISVASLEQQGTHEVDRAELHHRHLPRLAEAEYVKWDRDADTVSRGPTFSEVKPLVQLLKEYNTAFPE